MKGLFALAAVLLAVLSQAQSNLTVNNIQPIKKGLTMQATVWPSY